MKTNFFIIILFLTDSCSLNTPKKFEEQVNLCGLNDNKFSLGDTFLHIKAAIGDSINVNDDVYSNDQKNQKTIYYYDTTYFKGNMITQSIQLNFYLDTLTSVSVSNYGLDIAKTLEFLKRQFSSCKHSIDNIKLDSINYNYEDDDYYFSLYKIKNDINSESISFLFTYPTKGLFSDQDSVNKIQY